jgi:hypothetical protein
MTTKRKHIALVLTASLALTLMLAILSGCGVPPNLPTPTLVAQVVQTHTPTPVPTATPTQTPTPRPTNTPTPAPTATKAISSAAKATAHPKALSATATPETLVIVITEAEANKMAQKALANQKEVQIDNVQVDFRPDEMYVSGDTKIGFFTLNIGLLVTIEPVQGKPEVTIQEIYVNDGVATGFIREQIEAMIAPHLDQLAMVGDDFYVEDVTITDDEMIITGHYK